MGCHRGPCWHIVHGPLKAKGAEGGGQWSHLTWHKGSALTKPRASHTLRGCQSWKPWVQSVTWEQGQWSEKKVSCRRRKGRSGGTEIEKQDSSIYNGQGYRDTRLNRWVVKGLVEYEVVNECQDVVIKCLPTQPAWYPTPWNFINILSKQSKGNTTFYGKQ